MKRAFISATLLLICVRLAQASGAPVDDQNHRQKTFDISVVRPSASSENLGGIRRLDAGLFSVFSMTLRDLIALVYHVKPYQIIGGPKWTKTDRFDVTGKDSAVAFSGQTLTAQERTASLNENDEKMRNLLSDRFALTLRPISQIGPVLRLVPGKNARFSSVPCSSAYRLQKGWVNGAIHVSSLVSLLRAEMERPIEDGTGLKDCYFMDARWTTDPNNTSLPQIPTALHDLGFSLKPAKGTIEFLVIDRAERPRSE